MTKPPDGEAPKTSPAAGPEDPERRKFVQLASTGGMAAGLIVSYGTLGAYAGRYLYPPSDTPRAWQFVADLAGFPVGASLSYKAPDGAPIAIARQGEGEDAESFIALSSTCPHLGCQVHWEGHNDRFFCPCHNGVFDPSGQPQEGPPAAAGTPLSRYPLEVRNGLLFILVPMNTDSA